jgi:hypothetical protein
MLLIEKVAMIDIFCQKNIQLFTPTFKSMRS